MEYQLKEIVEASKNGDRLAIEELIARVKPLILSNARKMYGSTDTMDDLIQEGYTIVMESLREYEESRNVPYLGYLKRKLYYGMLNAVRKEWKDREVLHLDEETCENVKFIDIIVDTYPGTEEIIEMKDEYQRFHRAIDMLTKKQKRVIIERFFMEKTLPEVEESMGVSYFSVGKIQERAIKKLREILGKDQKNI